MRYEILLAGEAVEDLKALRASLRTEVKDAIKRHLEHDPTRQSKSRIKRLRGVSRPQFRLRVGDVRVFYDMRETRVEILAIVAKEQAQAWLAREGENP